MTQQDLINEGHVEGKKSFEFLFKKIMNGFDWEKVHKTMIFLEWNWSFGNSRGVPDMKTIKTAVFDMLKRAYENETCISSGGFTCAWGDGNLYLSFTIEEFDSD